MSVRQVRAPGPRLRSVRFPIGEHSSPISISFQREQSRIAGCISE